MAKCSECERKAVARGLCHKDYMAWRKLHRDEVYRRGDPYDTLVAASIITVKGCWEVQGYRQSEGYSRIRVGGRAGSDEYGHRLSWERNVGPIPDDLVVDHLCKNRACINIEHLELVTREENSSRNPQSQITECVHGHAYTPENTGRSKGWRYCRQCNRDRVKRYNDRKKMEREAATCP